jgi:opacity protein-like surface antigen
MNRKILILIVFLAPSIASAQGYRNHWEWSVNGIYQESERSNGGGGSSLSVDNAFGLGFGFSYLLNERFSVGGEIEWLQPDYKATIIDDNNDATVINHEFSQFTGRFKGAFNFLEGPLTPYIEAGLGWTYIDSNVASGPPIVGCWWHPLWGYICDGYYDTYTETSFTYGGALGIRYELRGGTVIKLNYNNYELDLSGDAADPTLNAWRLEFAWGF